MNDWDVAIIGMSCRFPGAEDIEEFWQNLSNGVESVTFFSDDELLSAGAEPDLLKNPNYVRAKAILQDIDLFDAAFFGFSPAEAEITDPQHRLFLEQVWKALEHAGYNTETYEGSVGIFAGASMNTYLLNNLYPNLDLSEPALSYKVMIGNDKDFLPTRISYKLNLRGPGVNVQTACSTSLVAVHMACQSLLHGECDMALAGCVSVNVPHNVGYQYQEDMILSPDGHCMAFDARAKGTVGGSGMGIVVLKRLADAIDDKDWIHAVIKGSAVNNDGSLKVGYTAPGVDGQREVISEALAMAGTDPETVTYVETHGTGTILGDPIEIRALTQAFRQHTQKKGFCAVGSVKTNIGHLDVAAGMAGLIKTVLALKHKMLPPSLHFERPNPKIDFENSPFYVNTKLSQWNTHGNTRRAGVSSFGIGGTNAHVILEQAPERESSGPSGPWHLLALSAKTASALDAGTANLAEYLRRNPHADLADVAYTLHVGRRTFSHRRILVCQDTDEAVAGLTSPGKALTNVQKSGDRPVVFMFPGQGTGYANMGHGLYKSEPIFREQADLCSEILRPLIGTDLRDVLFPDREQTREATRQLGQAPIAELALFVTEYALAKLWTDRGITPCAMIGHGVGEYVAACLAGVFSLKHALGLISGRTQLIQQQKISLNTPQIPWVSTITGTWITNAEATDPLYWTSNLRQTVQLAKAVQCLLKEPDQILLELGPGTTLATLATQHPPKNGVPNILFGKQHPDPENGVPNILFGKHVVLSSLPPRENQSEPAFFLMTSGKLWLAGAHPDWSAFCSHEQRHRIPLPTYTFDRQQYWIGQKNIAQENNIRTSHEPSDINPNIADWFYVPVWKQSVIPALPVLAEHRACWLVFPDECGLGSELARQLGQNGQNVITVKTGLEFSKTGVFEYALNPQEPGDYKKLFDELCISGRKPEIILHMLSVTENSHNKSAPEQPDKIQDMGFYSLLFLAQALGKHYVTDKVRLAVISNNMQGVTGEENTDPEKATLLGPVRVIPKEHPNIDCCSIDIVFPTDAGNSAVDKGEENQVFSKLAGQLLTELSAKSPDMLVAYRGNHRWVQACEPVRLDEAECPGQLRERGVYLITGGLGSMGLAFAEYLAQKVQARLILVSRSELPSEDEWDQWISDDYTQNGNTDFISRLETDIERDLAIKGINTYEGLEENLNKLCSCYIYNYFLTKKTSLGKGKIISKKELSADILPKFEKFYNFFIRVLEEDKIISPDGENILFLKDKEEVEDPEILKKRITRQYPGFQGLPELLDHCARHCHKALTGQTEAISVLYPDGTADFLKRHYKNITEHDNERICILLAREIVLIILKNLKKRKPRILEIGAGTGKLTDYMTEALEDFNFEYVFTDIEKSFIINAEQKAKERGSGFMKFGILDISEDPEKQGYEKSGFDIILGLDVVHATPDIAESLGNLKKLLSPGGIILLTETVRQRRWTDMIWGLAQPWYFTDKDLRENSPLLSSENWKKIFEKQGYKNVRTYPQNRDEADFGLIIAQKKTEDNAEDHTEDYTDIISKAGTDENRKIQNKIRRLKRTEDSGSEVMLARADASDPEQMRSVISQAYTRFGTIHGVIHTAGVLGHGIIQMKTPEAAAKVLKPKVAGTLVLSEVLKDADLDFLILCSSISSVSPIVGQSDYCAANAFLDAYAHFNTYQNRIFTVSVDWGFWQELGMVEDAVMPPEYKEKIKQDIKKWKLSDAGVKALNCIISDCTFPQVIVSPEDIQTTIQAQSSFFKTDKQALVRSGHARPDLKTAYAGPGNELERNIAAMWQELFGIGQIGVNDDFFELGGDSLLGTQLISRLRESFQVELPISVLFDESTVARLSVFIEKIRGTAPNHFDDITETGQEEGEI